MEVLSSKKKKGKSAREEMGENGEQTFHMGTFDVGEEELDPGGRLKGGDAGTGRMIEKGLVEPE